MRFDNPWLLLLLPLCLLPLWVRAGTVLANGWLALAPRDRASDLLGLALRLLSVAVLAALVVAMADPYRPAYTEQRIGRGAEIVLVLDRSRSMDQGFAPSRQRPAIGSGTGPEALDYYFSQSPARLRESKGKVARQLLTEFTARRPDDRFALVVFSTLPMPVLDFTARPEVIQAAIAAGNIGRGLSETNIGLALGAALKQFEGRPYTGSRIVLLVSDGGDRLDPAVRDRLAYEMRKQRVSLYWIYLRSSNGVSLDETESNAAAVKASVEWQLHRFFQSLETPYRAFEATDSQALEEAIQNVDRLEKLPISYDEEVPRRDLAPWVNGLALVALLLLIGARRVELKQWA